MFLLNCMIQWVASASTGSLLLLDQLISDQVFKTRKVVIFKQQQRQVTDFNPKLFSDPATRLQVQYYEKKSIAPWNQKARAQNTIRQSHNSKY